MKKRIMKLSCITSAVLFLSACGAGTYVHDKMSQLTMQKRKLNDGSMVSMYINVEPTASWGCKAVGKPQYYNWLKLKTEAQFHFRTGQAYMMDKAVAYANTLSEKPNYINLIIPSESSFTTGSKSGLQLSTFSHTEEQAVIQSYQCKLINPEKRVGYKTSTNTSVLIGN